MRVPKGKLGAPRGVRARVFYGGRGDLGVPRVWLLREPRGGPCATCAHVNPFQGPPTWGTFRVAFRPQLIRRPITDVGRYRSSAPSRSVLRRRSLGMAVIRVTDASGRQWQYPLTTEEVCTIGRAPVNNRIVLTDPQASRHHAHIEYRDGAFCLVDGVVV